MKILFVSFAALLLMSCTNDEPTDFDCDETTATGGLSGLVYTLPETGDAESNSLQMNLPIENGSETYSLDYTCRGRLLSSEESLVGISCNEGFVFNAEGEFCESGATVFYNTKNLNPGGVLRVLDLDNELDQSALNTMRVLINDAEVFSSDVASEINSGKISLNSSLEKSLNILSGDYAFSALDDDVICFELGSESRSHCYTKSSSAKSSSTQVVSTVYDNPVEIDLLGEELEGFNFRGEVETVTVDAVAENGQTVATQYRELNHSGLLFDVEMTLESAESYRIELEANGASAESLVEVVLYRKNSFDSLNLQGDFLKKVQIGFVDGSLRRKKIEIDFEASTNQQAEELVVLIYGENKAYVRDFKIQPVPDQDAKNMSVFLTANPSRSFGTFNFVPSQYVPFGMPDAIGYGTFKVDDDEADYEVYTSYKNKFKTTGSHLHFKNDSDHDADLSLNFRGVGNSAQGGDSSDYLFGTRALDTGFDMAWSDLKTDPAVGILILHTEGGAFGLDGNFLKQYSSFSDETSVGGITETDTPTRFNNRVKKTLGDRLLNYENTRDSNAPVKDPLDLSNNSLEYFPDLLGRVFVEDDGSGGTQLNAEGVNAGYDLTTEYLFYLFDDQGPEWDSGGPEGALVGTFLEQNTFDDFLHSNNIEAGLDSDLDGVSNYIEYVTGNDPLNSGSMPFLDAYDLFDDEGNGFKAVTFDISKRAAHFAINVYETRPNGVESLVWSFDKGRGFESSNLTDVAESEFSFSITILSNGSPLEISDMRVEFN